MQKIIACEGQSYTVETDQALIDKSDLGKRPQTCKICGGSGSFRTWLCYENYFGLRDAFRYFECPLCEALQIEEIPGDISRYYKDGFHSFAAPDTRGPDSGAPVLAPRVLDIGCGGGAWLCDMARAGYVNLLGCDPYIDSDIEYPNGVVIKKCSVYDIQGEYDYIRLSHSFEHMPDPRGVFAELNRLLAPGPGARIELIIPVFPTLAFELYGPCCHQIEAPRHFSLHSVRSIYMLAAANSLAVTSVNYNDSGWQFYAARLIQQGYTYKQILSRADELAEKAEKNGDMQTYAALGGLAVKLQKSDIANFIIARDIR